ncbi:MAG: hypothetical protein Kilf2KO_40890 [Rhodospirillales bacterium]
MVSKIPIQGSKGREPRSQEVAITRQAKKRAPPELSRNRLARAVWASIGGLALGLGLIGIFLPLLPTTPLVILAAFAFAKSHPGLRRWLVEHRLFGPMIADWEATGAIAPRYKILACVLMAATLTGSILGGLSVTLIAIQVVCMSAAAAYVLSRPNGKSTSSRRIS